MVEPTVVTGTAPEMTVECEEVFGPVCTVNSYEGWPDAIRRINDSRYGLQTSVFTKDIAKALAARELIDSGAVIVNDAPIYRIDTMPFGGVKDSGLGREGARYAIEHMSELKLTIFNG
jgi:acyl-CoA reductase-like NAD-dependent aldehyde dehydrogenase